MLKFARKFYNTSPRSWLMSLSALLRRGVLKSNPQKDECQITKKDLSGCAQIFDETYFARRNPLIQSLIEDVRSGKSIDFILSGIPANSYDERIVEYPYFAKWLLSQPTGLDILDIGCVLNNKVVSRLLRKHCNRVWLCNVAIENSIFVQNPVFYHISNLFDAFPSGEQFNLVSCLSTIEHIGYDNSQYGCKLKSLYSEPNIDPLVTALKKIASLTASKGRFCISLPFGYREALVHPVTKKIASQVFDFDSLNIGIDILNSNGAVSNYEVFSIENGAWKNVDPSKCKNRYAHGWPAAGAVALLTGVKQ